MKLESSQEINIDTNRLIFWEARIVEPETHNFETLYSRAVEELSKKLHDSGVDIENTYKITIKVEEMW